MAKANGEMKIETGIPVPTYASRQTYPLDQMKVGHSFAIAADKVHNLRIAISQRHRRKGDGRRYTVRKQPEGYRCWRVE